MDKLEAEAKHFNTRDMADRRKVSWARLAGPFVQKELYGKSNRHEFLLSFKKYCEGKPGLALACGDMHGEASYFKLLGSSQVDGYDVSEVSLERAKQYCDELGLDTRLKVGDINNLKLPKNHYGLVVITQSFHHFEKIDLIARRIADSMQKDAIFILLDYIGPRYLQFTPQQLKYADEFFKSLPAKLRVDRDGAVRDEVHPPLRWGLSANEAIETPAILPALKDNFFAVKGLFFGGLMHPVLERISHNFNADDPDHKLILNKLWRKEQQLLRNGEIEPNFCELILIRKDSKLARNKIVFPPSKPIIPDDRYDWMVQSASEEIWRLKGKLDELRNTIHKRDMQISNLNSKTSERLFSIIRLKKIILFLLPTWAKKLINKYRHKVNSNKQNR